MKVLILTYACSLTESILGKGIITTDLYKVLKSRRFTSLSLYKIENEAPEGAFDVRIVKGKVMIGSNRQFGCELIDLSKTHTIVFEPTKAYADLHTGRAKEVGVLSMNEDAAGENALILLSGEAGPKNWKESVFEANTLDFGGQKVIGIDAII